MIDPEKELLKSSEGDSYSSARLGKGRIALLIVAAVLIAALAGAWAMFGTQLTAAMTIEKLDDNLWSMEYKGDYGFDGFLEQGGAKSDAEMGDYIASFLSHGFWKPDTSTAGGNYGCSTIAVTSSDGAPLFGRNFDWEECDKMLVPVSYTHLTLPTILLV